MITFKPKQVTKKLLSVLPERARDVLEKRYGLGTEADTCTLESIGQTYGITRERVRQIENYGIQAIQKSDVYKEFQAVFDELVHQVAHPHGFGEKGDLHYHVPDRFGRREQLLVVYVTQNVVDVVIIHDDPGKIGFPKKGDQVVDG